MNYIVLKTSPCLNIYLMKNSMTTSKRIGYFKSYLAYYCISTREVQWGFKGLEIIWTQC